jgi:hypothetical protein
VFDSEYFRTALQGDVDALGGSAVVLVHLQGNRSHRIRSVLGIHSGYVTLEAYVAGGDALAREPRWKEEAPRGGAPALETHRAVVSYESIAAVTIEAVRPDAGSGIGFGRA